ncbi:nucleotide-diphospho-sugar transferase [Teratosphaeria nubilosa]|uniref:Nucleotide-diphospho-sugar transferase n=1 Tax=Teratosphaeria nubilosa TaxID=161662 RepID=A0A6G1LKM6_9PEZI|nr:nucleotide-diphospho-sugar transferase [Teratosphaeria nubilosa]
MVHPSKRTPSCIGQTHPPQLPWSALSYPTNSHLHQPNHPILLQSFDHLQCRRSTIPIPIFGPAMNWPELRERIFCIAIGCIATSTLFLVGRLYHDDVALSLLSKASAWIPETMHSTAKLPSIPLNTQNSNDTPAHDGYAFATFLGPRHIPAKERVLAGHEDPYFVGARILAYQLLHAPDTKSNIPFVVLVPHGVDEEKKRRLQADGAIVQEVDRVDPGNVVTTQERWVDVIDKFRLWQMTQFERIAFLDADVVLLKRIDKLFDDPAAELQATAQEGNDWEANVLPSHYVLAGSAGTAPNHDWPPEYPFPWYMNAGVFVLRPDLKLFDYYMSLMHLPDLPFDPLFPEQNLLFYAHRGDGPMPWRQIDSKWVTHKTTVKDIKGGVHIAHEHFWEPQHKSVGAFLMGKKKEMEKFWAERDA